ncbi:MAG: hypothetical protein UT91_C0024G0016 [Parcubacteria group bacterium GW2011_GWA2_40_23]|nr:MAG: hypothetical protein UT91_C0024G0016 [Parcubacteria group bacterium GW2011_GWA2_40_23]
MPSDRLQYADERVASSFGYSAGFHPRSPTKQVEGLHELFPKLDASHVIELVPAQRHTESEFTAIIPKWQRVAKTYGEAVMLVVALLEKLDTV